jgi:hypothetical protein
VVSGGNTEKFIAVPVPGWRLGLRAGRARHTEIYDELRGHVGSSRSVCSSKDLRGIDTPGHDTPWQ